MKKITLLISFSFLFIIGCESTMHSNANNLESLELQELSSELQFDLGLSKSSTDALNGSLNRHGKKGKHREPGFLWKVAGEVSNQLSDEEKAVLFEKIDQKEIPLFGSGKGNKGKSGKKGRKNGSEIFRMLTDEQKALHRSITESYKEQFKSLKSQVEDGSLSKDDAKVQMDALKDAMRAELDALLTDEQRAQIEQNKAEREAMRKAYKDSSKTVMIDVLSLSDEQVVALDELMKEANAAAMALFEQSRNSEIDRETLRTSLQSLFSNRDEKLESLFNVKQLDIVKVFTALEMRMKRHKPSKGRKGSRSKG